MITKVQIGSEAAFAAGLASTLGSELRQVGHQAVCACGPQVDAEAAGRPLLRLPELLAWADGALRRHDPYAADSRERTLRMRANWCAVADRREHAERLTLAATARRTGMKGIAAHMVASAREERVSAAWSR